MRLCCLAILFWHILIPAVGFTQDSINYKTWWVELGAGGFAAIEEVKGAKINLSYNSLRGNKLRSVEVNFYREASLFGPAPEEFYISGSYLFGSMEDANERIKPFFLFGPGVMYGVRRGEYQGNSGGLFSSDMYEEVDFFSPKLSMIIGSTIPFGPFGVFVPPGTPYVPVAVSLFIDLSNYRPMIGFNLNLILGQLSRRG